MCRWFAYISPTEPCLLEDVLVTPKHSLAKQVHDHYLPKLLPYDSTEGQKEDIGSQNYNFNIDGLGIAWYTSTNADYESAQTARQPIPPNMQCQMLMIQQGKSIQQVEKEGLRPAMYKNVQPPMHDPNFRSICANTETRVLLAHIRASSGTAVTAVNNHPFVFGRHSFMHNGYITDFTTIRRGMTAKMSNLAFAGVNGGTDSEHLAAVYMTHLTANATSSDPFDEVYTLKQMSEAMTYAIRVAMTLQRDMLGDKRSANSLNLCATDGEKMVSCRYRNHETSQPPSLYYSDKAGVTLNRKYPDHPDGLPIKKKAERTAREEDYGTHLIIASEPSTYIMADWKLIGKNQQLTANEKGEFALEDLVQFGPEWNAKKA